MIYGIGLDVVEVSRFRASMERWGRRLLERVFTERELDYCLRKRFPERHLAVRFAGKVSLFKALGRPMRFRDVEIVNDRSGRPVVSVKGLEPGLVPTITLTHENDITLAQVIVERRR